MTITGDQSVASYLEAIGARSSTPGGGAVAAIVAAEACALIEMVLNFTKSEDARLDGMLNRLVASREQLLELADADMHAFKRVMKAYKGEEDLQQALTSAAEVPASVIRICLTHIADAELIAELGNKNLMTDTAIAASLLQSSLDASELNVLINVKSMTGHTDDLIALLANLPAQRRKLDGISDQIKSALL